MEMKDYDSSIYEKMSVAVDLLVFTIENNRLKCLVVEREEEPFAGMVALPGVFVGIDETLEEATIRGIKEETGLEGIYFEQLYTFGAVKRDPRMRIISVSYMALVPFEKLKFKAGARATDVFLIDVDELLAEDSDKKGIRNDFAFDHKDILTYARQRLKNKVIYSKVAFHLVPKEFTLPELQKVYEILLGRRLYKANFRKKIGPYIEETDKMTSGEAHRPSRLYRIQD